MRIQKQTHIKLADLHMAKMTPGQWGIRDTGSIEYPYGKQGSLASTSHDIQKLFLDGL